MKKIILSAAILLSSLAGIAQIKEGSITYTVVFEGLPPEQAAMFDGSEQIVYFKGEKSCQEFTNAFVNRTTINDGKKTTTLIDQMGQKMYFETMNEEVKKEEKGTEPIIEYKDEIKKIAGYDCKKAIVKSKDEKGEEIIMNVWYTDQIASPKKSASDKANPLAGLKGVPLEFTGKLGPFNMTFNATSVSKNPVPDSKFVANTEGYIKKSMDDMKKMGGGK